ncbi:MAG: response regulator transcription factor [Planctomycetota bacterium]|jgi:FixJ family two-component response regulator
MSDFAQQHVFVVDDEVKVLEAVAETLGSLGVEVTCFVNPIECLEHMRREKCDLLVADLKMPEMDGIELLTNVKRHTPWVPVLVVTGYGDVPSAVRAIKAGAVDFVEKPLDKRNLLRIVKSVLGESDVVNTSVGKPLTAIQAKVLELVIDGKSNKQIADLLSRSVRTIEVHRANVMEKLGVGSLIDLVKRAVSLGLVDLTTRKESQEPQES